MNINALRRAFAFSVSLWLAAFPLIPSYAAPSRAPRVPSRANLIRTPSIPNLRGLPGAGRRVPAVLPVNDLLRAAQLITGARPASAAASAASAFDGLRAAAGHLDGSRRPGDDGAQAALEGLYHGKVLYSADDGTPGPGKDGDGQRLKPCSGDCPGSGRIVDPEPPAPEPPVEPQPPLEPPFERHLRLAAKLFHPLLPPGSMPLVAVWRRASLLGVPSDGELNSEMELSPLSNPERERVVRELFIQAGARPEEVVTQDAGLGRRNIYVVKKGRTDRVVVVGGHHDKVSKGAGTIDNWTGATMVTNLYQAMRDMATEATYVFITFAREEEGLLGSEFYVESLSAQQRSKIDSMINLDTLGVDGTFSWKNNSTRTLLALIRKVASREKLDLVETELHDGDSDSSSFRAAGIAAMTEFGATRAAMDDIIHSEKDTMAAFSLPHYKNAYLLTLALLKTLDREPVKPAGEV